MATPLSSRLLTEPTWRARHLFLEAAADADVERESAELVDTLLTLPPSPLAGAASHHAFVAALERVCASAPRACLSHLMMLLSARSRASMPSPALALAPALEAVACCLRVGAFTMRPLRAPAVEQALSECALAVARRLCDDGGGDREVLLAAGAALALCCSDAEQRDREVWGGAYAAGRDGLVAMAPARLKVAGALANVLALRGAWAPFEAAAGAGGPPPLAHHLRRDFAPALRRLAADFDCVRLARCMWAGACGSSLGAPTSAEERVALECFCAAAPVKDDEGGGDDAEDSAFLVREARQRAAESAEVHSLVSHLLLFCAAPAAMFGNGSETGPEEGSSNTFDTGLLLRFQHISRAARRCDGLHGGPSGPLVALPTVLSPALALQWMLAPLESVLSEAAAAAMLAAQQSIGDSEERKGVLDEGGGAAARRAASMASFALGVLNALVLAAPPAQLAVRLSAALEDGDEDSGARSHSPSPPPHELRLLQALIVYAVHCPLAAPTARGAALASLQALLTAFTAMSRLMLLRRLLDACPYPHVVGLLLDRVRNDVAAAHRSTERPKAFLSRRVGALIMAAAHLRLEQGLLHAQRSEAARLDAALACGVPPLDLAEPAASHLEQRADTDVALLSLLRLVLLVDGAAGMLRGLDLALLRDSYVRPLVRGASSVQATLREAAGVAAAGHRAHPAPFVASAAAATGAAERAGGAHGAALSKLFLLDAAAVPALELLEAAAARGR